MMATMENPMDELRETRRNLTAHYTEMRMLDSLASSLKTYANNRAIISYDIDTDIATTMDSINRVYSVLRVEAGDLALQVAVLERKVAKTLYDVPDERLKVLDGWASQLDGIEYRHHLPTEVQEEMKAQGIVMFYSLSDDLLEACGAMREEWGAWNGTTVSFEKGIVTSKFTGRIDLPDWLIFTSAPYRTFRVMEEGRIQCIGIVVHASDLGQPLEEDEE